MIKSKIDALERALELAITFCNDSVTNSHIVVNIANLPETQSDTELVKAFIEVMNNELEEKCKPNTSNYEELMKAIHTGNAGIVGEMPYKSTTE